MTPDRTALAERALALGKELLDLAARGEWDVLQGKLQERDAMIVALFSGLEDTSTITAEWIDILREIQAGNNRLLNLSIQHRNLIAKELSSFRKAQKAQSAYSTISGEE
ncbi:flagellar protein FliT [Methylococcus sp. EFPC2]|uniref:flagellar protein FliT n=1 Tax=Methylococcus sp. EFPC2 TaxID=2812648 RepID=UPI001966EB31|nr:flagellar protein FliT [Methylococcus sp. EFPC2]QSA95862.1 flagellar protein FliT [Methylococcus sp. EFPC2]